MTSDQERESQEPQNNPSHAVVDVTKPVNALSLITRTLTDPDLASPPVQRLLVDKIDHLERQVEMFSNFKEKYHLLDKKNAVLEEKLKVSIMYESISSLCYIIGSVLIGLVPFLYGIDKVGPECGNISATIGAVLIICGTVVRARRYYEHKN